ncbi:MAG TPA: adenylate/guanylate cyclase domain-containing protein, partial [Gaiellaceae bacterium]|nr:adenylate/guanylate cyclase domain-containing protein [Gaiellaceae bacterium]
MQPKTEYARSGDVSIAYQVLGEAPLDLVWIPSLTHHVELNWENPIVAQFLRRLASVARVLVFDKRGTGMSDRLAGTETLEERMDDIRAVMDAAGSERAVISGLGDGGPLAVLFAATYPERTRALILINTSPRFVRSPELPWQPTRAEQERRIEETVRRWGDPVQHVEMLGRGSPSMTEEERRAFARVVRLSVSPGAVAAYMRTNLDVDVRDVLPLIRVPTLVLQRTEIEFIDVRNGRYLAEHIPGATLVELPGRDFAPQAGDPDRLFAELEGFLGQVRDGKLSEKEPDRVLATVLFTDIVGSTARAAQLGDRAWREVLEQHHETVRVQLGRFRGREIDTAGDGFFASFDGPARAIHCACAIRDGLGELGLEIRVGLHAGECELLDGKVGGIAVHIGSRVAAQAQPGEVLVSSTVKDLV